MTGSTELRVARKTPRIPMRCSAEFDGSVTTLLYSWRGREHGGDDNNHSSNEGCDS